MRVDSIDAMIASISANQISYLDLRGLTNRITKSSLRDTRGQRYLEENQYRDIEIYEVIKALQLQRFDTKVMILRLLHRWDLLEILYLLDKDKLIQGLRFFDKRKILRLMMSLPKKLLIKMLRHVFSIDEIVGKMPTNELINILRSDKLPNRELIKGFQKMDVRFLHLLLYKIFGQDVSGLRLDEILDILFKTRKHLIIEGMKFLPFKALTPMVTFLIKQNPELLEEMSMAFMFKLFNTLSKPSLMKTFEVVPNDIIIERFLSQLPDQFLVLTAAQVDQSVLEGYLLSRQPGLLQMLGKEAA